MAKELYLYSPIYSFTAERLISEMELNNGEDITIRVNSPGGDVFAGWGIIAKMKESSNGIKMKIDGFAASMTAVALFYASNVEALEVSKIMIHRADMYTENEEQKTFLDGVNKDLRVAMSKKIDDAKLKEITGYSIKNIFEDEKRIDLWLTAKQAKQIGLVNKINSVNPVEIKAIEDKFYNIAAIAETNKEPEKTVTKNTIMNIEKLKAEHPELFTQVYNMGATAEKDRVGAWMAYVDVDAKAVSEGIKSGKPLSQTEMAEMAVKNMSKIQAQTIETENPKAVETDPKNAKTGEDKNKVSAELTAFEEEADKLLNLKTA